MLRMLYKMQILPLGLLLFPAALAQQNAVLLPWTPQQFTNTNGALLVSGKVCTFLAGTSTGTATFTDSTASVQNAIPPNAILLDSTARPTSGGIWLTPNKAYKIVSMTAGTDSTCNTGVVVKTQDNVTVGVSSTTNNTFTGSNTFNGPADNRGYFGILNNAAVIGSDASAAWKYPCTVAGVNQAVIDAMAQANGIANIVDARGCKNLTITSQINIGNVANNGLIFYFPESTWTVGTITDGTSCAIQQFGGTRIIGSGNPGSNGSLIHAGAGTNSMGSLYCTPNPGAGSYMSLENMQFYNPNGAAMANGAFFVQRAIDNFEYKDVVIASYGTVGLNIVNSCCGDFINLTVNGNHVANSQPVVIGNGNTAIAFFNSSIGHPGPGKSNVTATGGIGANITDFSFFNSYMEGNTTDTTTPIISLTNVASAQFIGLFPNALSAGASTASIISSSNSTAANTLKVEQLRLLGNFTLPDTTAIVDNTVSPAATIATDAQGRISSYTNRQFYSANTMNLIQNANPTLVVGTGTASGSGISVKGNGGFNGYLCTECFGNTNALTLGTNSANIVNFEENGNLVGQFDANNQFRVVRGPIQVPTTLTTANTGGNVISQQCSTSQKTETAADANLLTCAIPAVAGSYRIRFVMTVSAANAATLGWTATWTDSSGFGFSVANLPMFVVGTAAPVLTLTTSAFPQDLYGYTDIDVNNAGTSIVVKLTFSGTSFTAKASATVERII